MKNEQEMLDLFQVEELEKRYEMGWIKGGSAGVSHNTQTGATTVSASMKF